MDKKAENLAKARAAKQANQRKENQKKEKTLTERVKEILASDRVDPELKRKLEYAHSHAAHNGLMAEVRANLIREAGKGHA